MGGTPRGVLRKALTRACALPRDMKWRIVRAGELCAWPGRLIAQLRLPPRSSWSTLASAVLWRSSISCQKALSGD